MAYCRASHGPCDAERCRAGIDSRPPMSTSARAYSARASGSGSSSNVSSARRPSAERIFPRVLAAAMRAYRVCSGAVVLYESCFTSAGSAEVDRKSPSDSAARTSTTASTTSLARAQEVRSRSFPSSTVVSASAAGLPIWKSE